MEPHQIFIADNGSTREEQRKIRNVCKRYSRILSDGDLGQLNAMLNEQNVGSDQDSDSFKSCVECFDQMENIDLNPNFDFSNQLELGTHVIFNISRYIWYKNKQYKCCKFGQGKQDICSIFNCICSK